MSIKFTPEERATINKALAQILEAAGYLALYVLAMGALLLVVDFIVFH